MRAARGSPMRVVASDATTVKFPADRQDKKIGGPLSHGTPTASCSLQPATHADHARYRPRAKDTNEETTATIENSHLTD